MGALQAQEFADAVSNDQVQLEQALEWHLTANHWPSLPLEYVGILSRTIRSINECLIDEDDFIALPLTLPVIPNRAELSNDEDCFVIPARDLLDITHCWHFINTP